MLNHTRLITSYPRHPMDAAIELRCQRGPGRVLRAQRRLRRYGAAAIHGQRAGTVALAARIRRREPGCALLRDGVNTMRMNAAELLGACRRGIVNESWLPGRNDRA